MAVIETSTATTAVAAPVGFMALLIGAIGPIGADVMLVVISALAGCYIELSRIKGLTVGQAIGFIFIGVAVALVGSWAATAAVAHYLPALNGPYTPSIIAMFLGFSGNRMPQVLGFVTDTLAGLVKKKVAQATSDDTAAK